MNATYPQDRYYPLSIAAHWLTLALLIFASGWYATAWSASRH